MRRASAALRASGAASRVWLGTAAAAPSDSSRPLASPAVGGPVPAQLTTPLRALPSLPARRARRGPCSLSRTPGSTRRWTNTALPSTPLTLTSRVRRQARGAGTEGRAGGGEETRSRWRLCGWRAALAIASVPTTPRHHTYAHPALCPPTPCPQASRRWRGSWLQRRRRRRRPRRQTCQPRSGALWALGGTAAPAQASPVSRACRPVAPCRPPTPGAVQDGGCEPAGARAALRL